MGSLKASPADLGKRRQNQSLKVARIKVRRPIVLLKRLQKSERHQNHNMSLKEFAFWKWAEKGGTFGKLVPKRRFPGKLRGNNFFNKKNIVVINVVVMSEPPKQNAID